jgi:hypothetical protein
LAAACSASIALRFFSALRRYGTSVNAIGTCGQQPLPGSGRIAA